MSGWMAWVALGGIAFIIVQLWGLRFIVEHRISKLEDAIASAGEDHRGQFNDLYRKLLMMEVTTRDDDDYDGGFFGPPPR